MQQFTCKIPEQGELQLIYTNLHNGNIIAKEGLKRIY